MENVDLVACREDLYDILKLNNMDVFRDKKTGLIVDIKIYNYQDGLIDIINKIETDIIEENFVEDRTKKVILSSIDLVKKIIFKSERKKQANNILLEVLKLYNPNNENKLELKYILLFIASSN